MKKGLWTMGLVCFLSVWSCLSVAAAEKPESPKAPETTEESASEDTGKTNGFSDAGREKAEESDKDYVGELLGQVDLSELDELTELELLPGTEEKIKFSDVVNELIENGIAQFDYGIFFQWIFDAILYEINANRMMLLEAVLLAVGFSVLKHFSGAFRSAYISDLCFIMVYCVLAVMLLQTFSVFGTVVADTINSSVDFMSALVPAISMTMVFSSGTASGAGFYQMAFLVIYLVQWAFLKFLVPLIRVYVILELFNHFFEDEKFENLTELLKGFICWAMKMAGMVVMGLTVVQNLISPAKDKLVNGGIGRVAALIPGVGNVVNSVSEILLGSGMLIKNCVGAAALIVLACLCIVPMIKVGCLTVFYKLAAAVTEPVTDKRIVGCLKGMAEGGALYLKLMGYCVALFFLTIALTTAVSGGLY